TGPWQHRTTRARTSPSGSDGTRMASGVAAHIGPLTHLAEWLILATRTLARRGGKPVEQHIVWGEETDLLKGKTRSSVRRRRTAIVLAVPALALALSFAVVGVASGSGAKATLKFKSAGGITAGATYSGAKSDSGYIAKSDPSLLGRTDSTRVPVMLKYDFDA